MNISIFDFIKIQDKINIIDIRSRERFNNNHIPNASNIPYELLITTPEKYLNKNNKYYIYCQKGIKSRQVQQILVNKGYYVINILGGYEEWILEK